MTVDLILDNARVYNIQKKIDIVIGEEFSLATDAAVPIRWFTDNDPVLDITSVDQSTATIKAVGLGQSTLVITDNSAGFNVQKAIDITVIDKPQVEAVNLNPTATEILPK